MIRALCLVVVLGAGVLAAGAEGAASLDALVTDDKSKPVEDAVVYIVAPPTTAAAGTTATMDQVDKEFVPYVLPVHAGTAVRFPNKDNIRHHVYSFSAPKKFELPLYIGTPATPVVFDRPGVVALGCNIHDWMVAYVYVLPAALSATTGKDGRARIASVPPGAHEIRVWHPRLKAATEATGQRVTVPTAEPAQFVIGLKRDWRIPRPLEPRYR